MQIWGRGAAALVFAALFGGTAAAQILPSTGTQSCWGRVYSEAHLAANPGQRVREMRLRLSGERDVDQVSFLVQVVTTEDPNLLWLTDGECHQDAGNPRVSCFVWCDGGGFELEAEAGGDSLLLVNQSFALSSCGAPEGLEEEEGTFLRLEPDADHAVFRLYRLRAEMCGG